MLNVEMLLKFEGTFGPTISFGPAISLYRQCSGGLDFIRTQIIIIGSGGLDFIRTQSKAKGRKARTTCTE